MVKRTIVLLMSLAALTTAMAQRMLDISSGTFSSSGNAQEITPNVVDLSLQTPLKAARIGEENQVVREGRVWRYYSPFNGKMEPSEDIYLNVGFSGLTEIDGMDYMNCYAWKESDEFSEDKAALIAYMREEDGKVYVRYIPDAEDTALDKGINIIPFAPMMASYNHDLDALSQKDLLLFDNGLELGDMLWSVPGDNLGDRFKVVKVEEVECFDITRTAWTLDRENGLQDYYTYYEGIGDIYGLLPFPNSWPITYDAYPWILVEVIDQGDNIVFAPSQLTTGINNPIDECEVVHESLYTLGGVEIAHPTTPGVYMKTQLLKDGSRRTRKIIVK